MDNYQHLKITKISIKKLMSVIPHKNTHNIKNATKHINEVI